MVWTSLVSASSVSSKSFLLLLGKCDFTITGQSVILVTVLVSRLIKYHLSKSFEDCLAKIEAFFILYDLYWLQTNVTTFEGWSSC